MFNTASDMLLQIGQNNYNDLFTVRLVSALPTTKDYIGFVNEFLPFITESGTVYEEIHESGVLSY